MAADPTKPNAGQPAQPSTPPAKDAPVRPAAKPAAAGKPAAPAAGGRTAPVARPAAAGKPAAAQAATARPGQPAKGRPVAAAAKKQPLVRPDDPEEEEEQGEDITETILKRSPPWLVSGVFHMLLLLILGLIVIAAKIQQNVELTAEALVYAEELGLQTALDSPLGLDNTDKVEDPILTPQDMKQVEDPFAAPTSLDVRPDGHTATSDLKNAPIGMALLGRQEGSKKSLLGKYGGNATTEAAVGKGLEWLARQQLKDGSWSLTGPYRGGAGNENRTAATAMALLAFQGAGNTHLDGKFKANVVSGWQWLLKEQGANGEFFREGGFNHRFYTHGQASIAICEIFGMTKDPKLREPAQKAIQYCLNSQSPEGGWRYQPNGDSDVSVSGWVVMALQSARMAGLNVPKENLARVEQYLDKIALQGGTRYPYQEGKPATNTMTAEALLMRQYLGWARSDKRLVDACGWLIEADNLVNFNREGFRNVYYWYYATQVCHHMEGNVWQTWNSVMRQAVPENQIKTGADAGSWDPDKPTKDEWAAHGGRLYVTCLSIYMLEVYYRHLPIYAKVYSMPGVGLNVHPVEPTKPEVEKPAAKSKAKSDDK